MRSGLVVTDLVLVSRYKTSTTELLVLRPNLELEVLSSIVENVEMVKERM